MKKNLLLIACLCCILNLKSQDSLNKAKIGLDFSMGNNACGRANILPSITFTKAKHTVFAGPAFVYGMEINPYPPAYGIQVGYQFFPNGQKNRFNLFFEYDLYYIKKTHEFSKYISSPPTFIERSVTITSLDNYLSFGFKFNINSAIYLHTNVGLGVIWYKETVNDEYSNGKVNNYNYSNGVRVWKFHPYSEQNSWYNYDIAWNPNPPKLIGIFKLGLGFDVCALAKKRK